MPEASVLYPRLPLRPPNSLTRGVLTAGRDTGDDFFERVRRHRTQHVGVDVAGGERVDSDAARRTLLRQRFCDPVDARFRGSVVDVSVLAGLAIDRTDIDNPAEAPRPHSLDDRSRHVEAGREIGLDHCIPLLVVHAVDRCVAGDPGIVDEHLDRAEPRLDLFDALGAGMEIADIELEDWNAGLLAELPRGVVIATVIGRNIIAGVLQRY